MKTRTNALAPRRTWTARTGAVASLWLAGAATGWLAFGGPARAHENHAAHQVTAQKTRSEQSYMLPAVKVTRADGKRMSLAEALDDGRPVMLNFIYTSCNAICPVTSQVFVEVREKLGAERGKINMVSISIDPEQDTPAKLTEYARRFGSAGEWAHFTSGSADAVEIQRAFGAWRGDKMNHQPITYLRSAPGKPWVRLEGFFGPSALVSEYSKLVGDLASDDCSGLAKTAGTSSPPAGARAGITMKCKS
jgi:protein SCO1/2